MHYPSICKPHGDNESVMIFCTDHEPSKIMEGVDENLKNEYQKLTKVGLKKLFESSLFFFDDKKDNKLNRNNKGKNLPEHLLFIQEADQDCKKDIKKKKIRDVDRLWKPKNQRSRH